MKNSLDCPPSEPRNRALQVIQFAVNEYNWSKEQLKPDQSINFICSIGGSDYDVYNLYALENDTISFESTTDDGDEIGMTAPIEQVCFLTIVSHKRSDHPPREIGFHAIKDFHSLKSIVASSK